MASAEGLRRSEGYLKTCLRRGPSDLSLDNLSGACRRRTPRARSDLEGGIGKVSVRRVIRYLQIDTGPWQWPSACSEVLPEDAPLPRPFSDAAPPIFFKKLDPRSGTADVWYGAALNTSTMAGKPWALIVDGHGAVSERSLVDQQAGALLPRTAALFFFEHPGATPTANAEGVGSI